MRSSLNEKIYSNQIQLKSGMSVDKDSDVAELMGVIDETCATLKLVELTLRWIEARQILAQARAKLRELSQQISTQHSILMTSNDKDWIEVSIRSLEAKNSIVEGIETSGSMIASAYSDLASAQCKRVERRLLSLGESTSDSHGATEFLLIPTQYEYALFFLDRLSEMLTTIARREELNATAPD